MASGRKLRNPTAFTRRAQVLRCFVASQSEKGPRHAPCDTSVMPSFIYHHTRNWNHSMDASETFVQALISCSPAPCVSVCADWLLTRWQPFIDDGGATELGDAPAVWHCSSPVMRWRWRWRSFAAACAAPSSNASCCAQQRRRTGRLAHPKATSIPLCFPCA